MKKIIIILLCLLLCGCNKPSGKVEEITGQRALEIFENKETCYLLLVKSDCDNCHQELEVLKQAVKEKELLIYYVVVDDDVNIKSYPTLNEKYLNKITVVPVIYYIEEGVIIDHVVGKLSKEAFETWLIRLKDR